MTYQDATLQILNIAAQSRLSEIGDNLVSKVGRVVQSGPFKGMILPEKTSWGSGDVVPKLLGCYEQELHGPINWAISRNPEFVVNIGCAEGYYAVGLAKRLPHAQVHAFDSDPKAQSACYEAATLNDVTGQMDILGKCSPDTITNKMRGIRDGHGLFVIDVEGEEIELINSHTAPYFHNCNLVIELHDFVNPKITATLTGLLSQTHVIDIITETARDPGSFELIRDWGSFDKYLAMLEWRPSIQQWMVARSRA